MRCEHCGGDFSPQTIRGRLCSAKCRKAAWQRAREDRESRLRERVKALAKDLGLSPQDLT